MERNPQNLNNYKRMVKVRGFNTYFIDSYNILRLFFKIFRNLLMIAFFLLLWGVLTDYLAMTSFRKSDANHLVILHLLLRGKRGHLHFNISQ